MNQRDARLLSRLLETLDTLENDGEIVATVRQVRRIAGAQAFSGVVDTPGIDELTLADERHRVAVGLRALGLSMRTVQSSDPAVQAVLERTRNALIDGGVVAGDDLRRTLVWMRDMMEHAAEIVASTTMSRQPLADTDVVRMGLNQAMEMIRECMRGAQS